MTLDDVLGRLQMVRRNGSGWKALCPAHADKNPSLSINERDGKVLVHCHAGCQQVAVWEAMKGTTAGASSNPRQVCEERKVIAEYDYRDEKGELLFQVVRSEPKSFRQRRPDGNGSWQWNLNGTRRVLYRLPEVLAAKSVLVCEGEKDCETARALGLVATCNAGGAGKWTAEYSEPLRGKRITVIADADEAGRKHAQQVAVSLFGKAELVKLLEFPHAKDLTEWTAMGGKRDALLELIRNTPEWKPAAETPGQQAGAVLRCFSDIAAKPLRWLWPGRIPLGKLTLLIGDPGLGKSLLTADIASRITRSTRFPDGATCESGSVIFLSAEDDPADTIRPRLDAAGADVSRVHILEAVRVRLADGSLAEKPFNLETDVAALEGAIRGNPGVRLIVIDPISAYLGGVDSHSNAEVRGALAPLSKLAAQYGVSVVCVTHLRKSAGAAVHRAIASIAFTAAARSVWGVAADPSDADRKLLVSVKQNLSPGIGGLAYKVVGPIGSPCIEWEAGAVNVSANELLDVEGGEDRSERREAEEWLREYLADGPVAARDAIKAAGECGISKTTLGRACRSIGAQKRKVGGRGAGWEWTLAVKETNPIHTNLVSLDSLSNSLKTKPDGEPKNSKNSKNSNVESPEPLPFAEGEVSTFDEASGEGQADDDVVDV